MNDQETTRPVVFITGASSGIGAAIAKIYASKNTNLILAARRKEKLDAIVKECQSLNPNIKAIAVSCDVNRPEDLKAAVDVARNQFGRLDIVIANAGFGITDAFRKLTVDDYRRQFETNVFGVISTIKAAYDEIMRSKGRIVIMASVAGYVSTPGSSPYSMSKFAVRALGEALYSELKPKGVSVTNICPGFVDSEIFGVDNNGKFNAEHNNEKPPRWLMMDTDKAARQIVKAITKRKREKIITGHGKFAVFMKNHFPGLLAWLINTFNGDKHPRQGLSKFAS